MQSLVDAGADLNVIGLHGREVGIFSIFNMFCLVEVVSRTYVQLNEGIPINLSIGSNFYFKTTFKKGHKAVIEKMKMKYFRARETINPIFEQFLGSFRDGTCFNFSGFQVFTSSQCKQTDLMYIVYYMLDLVS